MSQMADFTAKDVQSLRQTTGAGMMDAKKALVESDGDFDRASKILRERGLAKVSDRAQRENAQGAIAQATSDGRAALVELKCETDFVAKSDTFVALAERLAEAVASGGEGALGDHKDAIDDLKVALKENIDVGRAAVVEVSASQVLGTYLHSQDGRGVNGVLVAVEGGSAELAHDVAVHIAFAKPEYLTRDEVPAAEVDEARQTLRQLTKAEGKPEAAWDKIVEGRLTGWYKERVLRDQPYVRDEKQTIGQLASGAGATIVGFRQLFIGG